MKNNFNDVSWLLGYYIDGWADLIEGMGHQAPEVKSKVIDQLNQRQMPDIEVGETEIKEGFFSDLTRPYVETKTSPGVRTFIYIEQHGDDLYTSWRSYLRPTINWQLILRYAAAAFIISVIVSIIVWIIAAVRAINLGFELWNSETFSTAIGTWFLFFAAISIGLAILVALAGQLIKKDSEKYFKNGFIYIVLLAGLIGSFFFKGTGHTMYDEISLLFTRIKEVFAYTFTPFLIVPFAINILGYILVGVAIIGFFLRKNLFAFIIKEPSIFDTDDITAMNLSVHQSILRGLDEVGIEGSKLRLKGQYKSGRSGEVV